MFVCVASTPADGSGHVAYINITLRYKVRALNRFLVGSVNDMRQKSSSRGMLGTQRHILIAHIDTEYIYVV